jgi:DNA-binding XRE family transcriptional regulator
MTFGQKLKHIRKLLDLTQGELAESIGSTQTTIHAIEAGTNKNASFGIFQKLVTVHNVNPYFFIIDSPNEPPIIIRNGTATKPLLQKLAKYEKLVEQFSQVRKGK